MVELFKGLVFVGGWMLMTAFLMACVGIAVRRVLLRRKKEPTWRDVVR
jgi:hypothetical protein